mmetsp:Transcript_6554/g.21226  ORF Transcript_6554/g.21226 Transcript_6554/m.21226 type:complete len:241 (+) Transcript_6554:338-1060(+)
MTSSRARSSASTAKRAFFSLPMSQLLDSSRSRAGVVDLPARMDEAPVGSGDESSAGSSRPASTWCTGAGVAGGSPSDATESDRDEAADEAADDPFDVVYDDLALSLARFAVRFCFSSARFVSYTSAATASTSLATSASRRRFSMRARVADASADRRSFSGSSSGDAGCSLCDFAAARVDPIDRSFFTLDPLVDRFVRLASRSFSLRLPLFSRRDDRDLSISTDTSTETGREREVKKKKER